MGAERSGLPKLVSSERYKIFPSTADCGICLTPDPHFPVLRQGIMSTLPTGYYTIESAWTQGCLALTSTNQSTPQMLDCNAGNSSELQVRNKCALIQRDHSPSALSPQWNVLGLDNGSCSVRNLAYNSYMSTTTPSTLLEHQQYVPMQQNQTPYLWLSLETSTNPNIYELVTCFFLSVQSVDDAIRMFSSDNVSMWFVPSKNEGTAVSSAVCIGSLCQCLLSIVQLYVYNISDPARAGIHWLFNDVLHVNTTVLSPTGTQSPTGTPNHTGTPKPTGTSTTSQSTIGASHTDQVWKIAVACVFSVPGGIVLLVFLARVIRRHMRPGALPAVGPD